MMMIKKKNKKLKILFQARLRPSPHFNPPFPPFSLRYGQRFWRVFCFAEQWSLRREKRRRQRHWGHQRQTNHLKARWTHPSSLSSTHSTTTLATSPPAPAPAVSLFSPNPNAKPNPRKNPKAVHGSSSPTTPPIPTQSSPSSSPTQLAPNPKQNPSSS